MTNNLPATYEAGELLNLRLPALRYDEPRHGGHRLVGDAADGEAYEIVLPAGARYELERVAPPEWPPVAGDIWTDRFLGEWMALDTGDGNPWSVRLRNADDDSVDSTEAGEVAENWGPMRLLRRRGWSPTPPAADPEPAPYRVLSDAEQRAGLIAGLRQLADLLESRPDLKFSPNNILWNPGLDQLPGWAQVLDARIDVTPAGEDKVHHTVHGRLGTLLVEPYFIADAPKPEPEPASVSGSLECGCAADPAPAEPAAEAAPVEQPQDWYFTFGAGHTNAAGENLANRYVRIHGTYEGARAVMLERFGNRWSHQYPSAQAAGVAQFLMTELVLDEPTSAPDKPAPAIAVHYETGGWKGEGDDGKCGVECACGTTFDGFDTLADAAAALDQHIEAGE